MRKIIIFLVVCSLLVFFLLVSAFVYIDLNRHMAYRFDIIRDGARAGIVDVDRYVTEGKILFKSIEHDLALDSYPNTRERLYIGRGEEFETKYIEESEGARGQKKYTLIEQKGDKTNFLYLSPPQYMEILDFDTGETTIIYSELSPVLIMALMEKYNYWKKGVQFKEVMLPVNINIPPLRTKIGVKDVGDEHILISGKKTEAAMYELSGEAVSTVLVYMSSYAHTLLKIEVPSKDVVFLLTDIVESPAKRIIAGIRQMLFSLGIKQYGTIPPRYNITEGTSPDKEMLKWHLETKAENVHKDIFFNSSDHIIAGSVWQPKEGKSDRSILLIRNDTVMSNGDEYLMRALAGDLSSRGFNVMMFDYPGQGKSQGNFLDIDDAIKIKCINDAIAYLREYQRPSNWAIALIGYSGGGYLAAKAGSLNESVDDIVMLGMPHHYLAGYEKRNNPEEGFQMTLNNIGYGRFDQGFLLRSYEMIGSHTGSVKEMDKNVDFFMGYKLPVAGYRSFLARDPIKEADAPGKKFMFISNRQEGFYDANFVRKMESILGRGNRDNKVKNIRKAGPYMGKVETSGEESYFKLDGDMLLSISSWIKENKSVIPASRQQE